MMHPGLIGKVAERFAALADENRLRLLMRLRQGPCNVTVLTEELGIAQASVSKHLSVLKRVGLVEATRQGTQAVYEVRDASVFEMCRHVCDGVVRQLREETAVLKAIQSTNATGGRVTSTKKARTA
jgi:DNA-binding transcriptional ArsR family regulator